MEKCYGRELETTEELNRDIDKIVFTPEENKKLTGILKKFHLRRMLKNINNKNSEKE